MKTLSFIPLLIIIIISLLSIRLLCTDGFFPMHDDTQVARVIVMGKALRDGQFPVRWVSDLGYGYGYPLFNFYGPLPYYIGGIFSLIGVDPVYATKLMIGMGIAIGSVAVYILAAYLVGVPGGIFASLLFSYFPYRAVQLYVRGAIGELWAVSFIPLVMYGCLKALGKHSGRSGVFVASFSLAAVILSHTVFGYLTVGGIFLAAAVVAVLRIWAGKKVEISPKPLLLIIGISLGLTSFFWLPAFFEMSYTNVQKVIGESANYSNHFVCLSQLWDSPWGFAGSAQGCMDGMSFRLGKIHIILFVVALGLIVFAKKKIFRVHGVLLGIAGIGCCMCLAVLPFSEPIWKVIPFSSFVQYPWRLLGPIGICISVVAGYIFYKKTLVNALLLFAVLGAGVIMYNDKVFSPQFFYTVSSDMFFSSDYLRWDSSTLSDEYLPKDIPIPADKTQIIKQRIEAVNGMTVEEIKRSDIQETYVIHTDIDRELKLNMAFFPGWTFVVNGQQIEPRVVRGQPYVILSAGDSLLHIQFTNTPIRWAGNIISLVVAGGSIFYLVYGKKVVSHHRHTCV